MWLDQATPPNHFLNLSRAAATSQWLAKSQQLRFIGEAEPAGGAESQFRVFPPLSQAFDGLIYLRETAISQFYRAAHPAG